MKTPSTKQLVIQSLQQHLICGVVLVLVLLSNQLNAQSASSQFVPFPNFLAATAAADSSDYVARPQNRVRDASAFEEMRRHILTMYMGAQVSHSFVEGRDYIDCIPIEQQPSIRLSEDKTIAAPPPGETSSSEVDSAAALDLFGNSMQCELGTIPMLRMTLEQLSRFQTLQGFFQKGPNGAGRVQLTNEIALPAEVVHKYALARQQIYNEGGGSVLNIWEPEVDMSAGQDFSVSQMWFSGGTRGDAKNPLQTVEGGWQNYPGLYGDQQSRLVIFYTSNDYIDGYGCYDLDCKAFVQVNHSWSLGTPPGWLRKTKWPPPFDNYSVYGGDQYELRMEWYLYKGNWWLGLAGEGNVGTGTDVDGEITWIGYYPGKLFKKGQMSRFALSIAFGGETAGTASWGPMGSGHWPAEGYKKAAYQREIQYKDLFGRTQQPSLTPQQPSPGCYKITPSRTAAWGVSFYFGGPGGEGTACD